VRTTAPAPYTKELVDLLNRYLLRAHAQGRRVVLIVDEAQNLAPEVLEQVRLLTNLETETQKLLQIILIGQPELRKLLAREDLRQLAQRITGRYHLDPLSREETAAYVRHRCASPAPRPISSRAARCARSTASAAAFRASSTSSATGRCSAPTPRICTRYPARWCVAPQPRCSARNCHRAGCRC
jgi:type II secretory pathway predicted ATPase ExeA